MMMLFGHCTKGNEVKLHIGLKMINAVAMTRGEYNILQGWQIPANENSHDAGYLVEYLDGGKPNHPDYTGYISWTPAEVFEKAYKANEQFSFSEALYLLKQGHHIARNGWNGKGMHVELWDNKTRGINPHFALKNVQGTYDTWVPSVSDLLANDWCIVTS